MAVFGSKNGEGENNEQMGTRETPVDLVLKMRKQGLSNNQIITSLQREGYDTTQVFDAMNQADLSRANGAPVEGNEEVMQNEAYPAEPQEQPEQQLYESPTSYEPSSYGDDEITKIEELVEAVVEEKWVDLVKDVNKIIEWKASVESDITSAKQEIKDLKIGFNELQKSILEKVDGYDKNIVRVSTNIKAMENVFQKVIPKFTENINELSRTVERLKGIANKSKK